MDILAAIRGALTEKQGEYGKRASNGTRLTHEIFGRLATPSLRAKKSFSTFS
jgi:hypothetical protein